MVKKHQLMTAGMVHVTNLTQPCQLVITGSERPSTTPFSVT
jgi:hypothetical protein